jgi:undecaprenyl-diphosphatase
LYFKADIEQAFSSARLVGLMLLVTTALLFLTAVAKPRREALHWYDSILIGLAQALAILPGISRSGATISTAMYAGIDQRTAFKFSFLLSLPAIFGAFILQLKDALDIGLPKDQLLIYLTGMIAAFISGYACLVILRKVVLAGKFAWFGIYTLIIAVLTLIFAHG